MEKDSKEQKESHASSHHHHHQKEPKKDNNVVHVCIKFLLASTELDFVCFSLNFTHIFVYNY